MYALARVDFKQGIVGGALDKGLVLVKKLVFQPFQVYACMGAAVDIGMELPLFMDNKNVEVFTS